MNNRIEQVSNTEPFEEAEEVPTEKPFVFLDSRQMLFAQLDAIKADAIAASKGCRCTQDEFCGVCEEAELKKAEEDYANSFPDWEDPGEKPEQIPAARLPERKFG